MHRSMPTTLGIGPDRVARDTEATRGDPWLRCRHPTAAVARRSLRLHSRGLHASAVEWRTGLVVQRSVICRSLYGRERETRGPPPAAEPGEDRARDDACPPRSPGVGLVLVTFNLRCHCARVPHHGGAVGVAPSRPVPHRLHPRGGGGAPVGTDARPGDGGPPSSACSGSSRPCALKSLTSRDALCSSLVSSKPPRVKDWG